MGGGGGGGGQPQIGLNTGCSSSSRLHPRPAEATTPPTPYVHLTHVMNDTSCKPKTESGVGLGTRQVCECLHMCLHAVCKGELVLSVYHW